MCVTQHLLCANLQFNVHCKMNYTMVDFLLALIVHCRPAVDRNSSLSSGFINRMKHGVSGVFDTVVCVISRSTLSVFLQWFKYFCSVLRM